MTHRVSITRAKNGSWSWKDSSPSSLGLDLHPALHVGSRFHLNCGHVALRFLDLGMSLGQRAVEQAANCVFRHREFVSVRAPANGNAPLPTKMCEKTCFFVWLPWGSVKSTVQVSSRRRIIHVTETQIRIFPSFSNHPFKAIHREE